MVSASATLVLIATQFCFIECAFVKKPKSVAGLKPVQLKDQISLLEHSIKIHSVDHVVPPANADHSQDSESKAWSFLQGYHQYMPDESWFVGIAMTIVGQTICVIGMQMQKISHLIHTPEAAPNKAFENGVIGQAISKESIGDSSVTSDQTDNNDYYFLQWRWILGGGVWALGHIMCWAALGLAPLSILCLLQSWNIVVALALAPVLLNETLPPRAVEYACLLVVGCVVVVWFGPRTEKYEFETVDSLSKAFIAPASIVVHCICFGLLLVSMSTSLLKDTLWRVERYVLMSATCAWYAALCSKSMSMMVITSVAGNELQISNFGFWIFCVGFIIFAVGQIHFMNLGLKYGQAAAVMPLYEAVSMIGQLFFGGILFREFENFQGSDEVGFIIGVIIVVASLALLVKANRDMEVAAALAADSRAEPPANDKLTENKA